MSAPTVVIATHEEVARAEMRDALVARGYAVTTASTAHETLAAVEQVWPDLVVLDSALAGDGAAELLRSLRARLGDDAVPIIMTGRPVDADALALAKRLGVTEYLLEPVTGAELLMRVEATILPPGGSAVPPSSRPPPPMASSPRSPETRRTSWPARPRPSLQAPLDEELAAGLRAVARPLRDFLLDLKLGPAPAAWLEVAPAVVGALKERATSTSAPFPAALDALAASMTAAIDAGERRIEGEARESILAAYDVLAIGWPAVFALPDARGERESMIVRALLEQMPGVFFLTIDRLEQAGLLTLRALTMASGKSLATTAGIAEEHAQAIVERFRAYEHERNAARAAGLRPIALVRRLVGALGEQHRAFVQAEAAEDGAAKRQARKERDALLLRLTELLARLGETDVLREVRAAPFARKLALLEACAAALDAP